MSSSSLQQHLSKLVEPGPPRNYAIAAIFDVAARAAPSQHTEAALLRCLALQDAAAVAVATERLVEMVVTGKYDMAAAQILVLSALAVAVVAPTVVVLSDCATRLFAIKLEATSWRDGANELSRMPWNAHPLTKVIRAAPGAASTLVSNSCQMLLHAADKNTQETGSAAFDATLSAFHPFFLSALLHRGITAEHPEIPGMLHDALARVACALSHAPPAQTSLLRWMVRVLPLLPVNDTKSQALAVTCVYNVIDVIFACEEEPNIELVCQVISVLLHLLDDIDTIGGDLKPLAMALEALASRWPSALLPFASTLARLASHAAPRDACAVLAALCTSLQSCVPSSPTATHPVVPSSCPPSVVSVRKHANLVVTSYQQALLLACVVPSVAYSLNKDSKRWLSHAAQLATLASCLDDGSIQVGADGEKKENLGHPFLRSDAHNVLASIWSNEAAALQWLHCFHLCLASHRLAHSPQGQNEHKPLLASGQGRHVPDGSENETVVNDSTAAVLFSLLHHPLPSVHLAAIEALIHSVSVVPSLGLTALPLLIHRLRSLGQELFLVTTADASASTALLRGASTSSTHVAYRAFLSALHGLPLLARRSSTLPFVIRAMQPLLAESSPVLLQAAALRMLCEMWTETGRGFQQLRTAILSYGGCFDHATRQASTAAKQDLATPSTDSSSGNLPLRIAVAHSLANICDIDGARAQELIHVLHAALRDPAPAVHAPALHAVASLCDADVLDFYATWRVLRGIHPTLPADPVAAAAWLRMLSAGALDVEVYPEVARGAIDALWAATSHSSAIVRRQAYDSLLQYDPAALERIDALGPLWKIAALLESEHDAVALDGECTALVSRTLRYEYAVRRRLRTIGGGGGGVGFPHQRHRVLNDKSAEASHQGTERSNQGELKYATPSSSSGFPSNALGIVHSQPLDTFMHRVCRTLPKALLGGGATSLSEEFLRRLPQLPLGAVLYLWAPSRSRQQAPTTQIKSAAAAMEAQRGANEYARVFRTLCCVPFVDALPGGGLSMAWGPMFVRFEIPAWVAFLRRWVAACIDATSAEGARDRHRQKSSDAAPHAESARDHAMRAVWSEISEQLKGKSRTKESIGRTRKDAAVTLRCLCAAAALVHACSSARTSWNKTVVQDIFDALLSCAQGADEFGDEAIVRGTACAAMGHVMDAVRGTIGVSAVTSTLDLLENELKSNDDVAVRDGCAVGLALASRQLMEAGDQPLRSRLRRSAAALVAAAFPCLRNAQSNDALLSALREAILNDIGSTLPRPDGSNDTEEDVLDLRDAALYALADGLPTLHKLGLSAESTRALHDVASNLVLNAQETREFGASHAAAFGEILAATTILRFSHGDMSNQDLCNTLKSLDEKVLGSSSGKVCGAAAATLGRVLSDAVQQGFDISQLASEAAVGGVSIETCFESLMRLLNVRADHLQGGVSAKRGASVGLHSLLQTALSCVISSVDVQLSERLMALCKRAIEALQETALRDANPLVRTTIGWSLGELCWAARRGTLFILLGAASSSSPSSAARGFELEDQASAVGEEAADSGVDFASTAKELSSLPAESALKYLVSAVFTCRWPSIDSESRDTAGSRQLSASHAGAALRCLAAAPRLPFADWTVVCRKLLRMYPHGNNTNCAAVQQGCILLAAAHGSSPSPSQLSRFIALDIFGDRGKRLLTWTHDARVIAMGECLPRLLRALPDADASAALDAACTAVILSAGLGEDELPFKALEMQSALFKGLATIIESKHATLSRHAGEAAVLRLLPIVSVSGKSALQGRDRSTLALPLFAASEDAIKAIDVENRLWQAMLHCVLVVERDRVLTWLQDASIFDQAPLHWTWVASALVANGENLRALQLPRNAVLNGELRDAQEKGGGVGVDGATEEAIVLMIARGLSAATTSTASQTQQWIADVAHAAGRCGNARGAGVLAACAAVGIAAARTGLTSGTSLRAGIGWELCQLTSSKAALEALPKSLASLLARYNAPETTEMVKKVVASLEFERNVQRRCCVALRHALAAEAWMSMCEQYV